VQAAVAVILFEGGMNLRIDHLRRSQRVIRRLITLGGGLVAWLLRSEWVPEGPENLATLACVLLLFEGSEALLQHSGLLSVAIAGGVVGNVPRVPNASCASSRTRSRSC
jgi:NhaP-type Na+/H+ or K+/H+ antiporter